MVIRGLPAESAAAPRSELLSFLEWDVLSPSYLTNIPLSHSSGRMRQEVSQSPLPMGVAKPGTPEAQRAGLPALGSSACEPGLQAEDGPCRVGGKRGSHIRAHPPGKTSNQISLIPGPRGKAGRAPWP